MRERTDRTLLIDFGDLPSLTAIAVQPDASRLVLWHPGDHPASRPGGGDENAARRRAFVEHHGRRLGVADTLFSGDGNLPAGSVIETGLADSLLLTQAAVVARAVGAGRVIWPVQVGPAPELVMACVERAAVVSDLTEIDGRGPDEAESRAIVIDLPLVDLDDAQLVDLAEDAGAPLAAFWPCDRGLEDVCEEDASCDGCRRWREAFALAGRPWPMGVEAR